MTTVPADADAHYTRIEVWNLNQSLRGRTMGKVRDHLREIYRGFLRDDRVILTVAGGSWRWRAGRGSDKVAASGASFSSRYAAGQAATRIANAGGAAGAAA